MLSLMFPYNLIPKMISQNFGGIKLMNIHLPSRMNITKGAMNKNLGWLGYIGDYTTQLHRDFHIPL